jgi:RNA polymerase sigma-70 factor (ECF subfamily)
LAELCDAYYEPVLAFLRCETGNTDAARDLAHAFFEKLLAGAALTGARPAHGRFRSYLLGAAKHFLAHRREAAGRLKRGAGVPPLTLEGPESRTVADIHSPPPDLAFDRQWALTTLARALESLRRECRAEGREHFFETAKPLLTGDVVHGEQAALAAGCGMPVTAFRMAVHRLKRRYRRCVSNEVATTLADPAMVDEELQALFAALGGTSFSR